MAAPNWVRYVSTAVTGAAVFLVIAFLRRWHRYKEDAMAHKRSPVELLMGAIAGAPFKIAPEREQELAELRDELGTGITIEDRPGFVFNVNLQTHEITTSVATLEYLWCSTYAHLILYKEYTAAQRRADAKFNMGGNVRSRSAIDLLNWSINNIFGQGNAAWPPKLPRPASSNNAALDIKLANEIFLSGVAWIIHHELAHLRLQHPPIRSSRSHVEEREADLAATKWILDQSKVPKESRKRMLGIAVAILALQGIEEDTPFRILDSHPHAFVRIDYCLAEADVPDDAEVYAFAACVMQMQLASKGIDLLPDGKNFREIFSECLIAFARPPSSIN
jgi:hypothetical protein